MKRRLTTILALPNASQIVRLPIALLICTGTFLFAFSSAFQSAASVTIEVKDLRLKSGLTLPCTCIRHSRFDGRTTVTVITDNPEDLPLNYTYHVSGGRIIGAGPEVIWDISGFAPGEYSITVRVDDGVGSVSRDFTKKVIAAEPDCDCPCECPSIVVYSRTSQVRRGDKVGFEAVLAGGRATRIGYRWNVTNGEIKSGQGTPTIVVVAKPKGGGSEVIANLETTLDIDCGCDKTASESVPIAEETKPRPLPPDLHMTLDETTLLLECRIGEPSLSESRKSEDSIIDVFSGSRIDVENDGLQYAYAVTGGSIIGTGPKVRWDLTGNSPGTYNIIVTIGNGRGASETMQQTVTVAQRDCPDVIECPSFSLAPARRIGTSDDYIVKAKVDGGPWDDATYSWTANGGTILAGQGTKSVRVRAKWSASDPTPHVDFSVLVPEKFRHYCQARDSVFLSYPKPQ